MWVAEDMMPWSEWYLNTVEARGFGLPDSDTYTSCFTRLHMSRFCWVWWKRFCTPSSCKVSSDKLWQNICFNIPSQWQTSPPRCVTHYTDNVSVCSFQRYALFMANLFRNRQKWYSVERGRYAIATRCWDNRDVLKHVARCHGGKSQTGQLFMGRGKVKSIFHWVRSFEIPDWRWEVTSWPSILKNTKYVYSTQTVYMHSTYKQRLYTHLIAYIYNCCRSCESWRLQGRASRMCRWSNWPYDSKG